MALNCVKLLSTARVFPPKICRALHRSAVSSNYWRRRDSGSELSNVVNSFENYIKEIDREMNRVFGDFRRMSPLNNLPRIFAPFDWNQARDIPIMTTDGDKRLYKLELDMQGMKPEDINITLKNNELTITARRDEKREDGSRFVRENTYHYSLPDEINPDTVRSSLSNGILSIEAQLPALESKEIPINIESGEKSTNSDNSNQKK